MKEGRAKAENMWTNRSRKHPKDRVCSGPAAQSWDPGKQKQMGKVSVSRVTLQVCVSQEEKPRESCLEMSGLCGLGIWSTGGSFD